MWWGNSGYSGLLPLCATGVGPVGSVSSWSCPLHPCCWRRTLPASNPAWDELTSVFEIESNRPNANRPKKQTRKIRSPFTLPGPGTPPPLPSSALGASARCQRNAENILVPRKLECLVALCRTLHHPQLIEEKF